VSTRRGFTGGCQCGAVRFRVAELGSSSICHCRMCQKQFGSFFGPLVTCTGIEWTRGQPKRFQSSNKAFRGFCEKCGTPLTYEQIGADEIELAIGAFDDPTVATPTIQLNPKDKLPFVDALADLRVRSPDENPTQEELKRGVKSFQHPDHDT
jgi:hypothetical protein